MLPTPRRTRQLSLLQSLLLRLLSPLGSSEFCQPKARRLQLRGLLLPIGMPLSKLPVAGQAF